MIFNLLLYSREVTSRNRCMHFLLSAKIKYNSYTRERQRASYNLHTLYISYKLVYSRYPKIYRMFSKTWDQGFLLRAISKFRDIFHYINNNKTIPSDIDNIAIIINKNYLKNNWLYFQIYFKKERVWAFSYFCIIVHFENLINNYKHKSNIYIYLIRYAI